jgi:acetate kinase
MKAMTLIPEKVKKDYRIRRTEHGISIHHPAYVNVDFDKDFHIDFNEITCHVGNGKVQVTLWRRCEFMHVAIFRNTK